jgi:hypothetical protein
MDLFDQDEAIAFAMVQILALEGLVAEAGKHGLKNWCSNPKVKSS